MRGPFLELAGIVALRVDDACFFSVVIVAVPSLENVPWINLLIK